MRYGSPQLNIPQKTEKNMKFTKMQGAGNDYVYVNGFTETIGDRSAAAKFVSDRHFGIGADGLVVIDPSDTADFKMDMYNADGSQGKMCGNAIRCVAKYVYDNKMTDKAEIAIETLSGIKYIKAETENGKVVSASVNMGEPILTPSEIPTRFSGEAVVNMPIELNGGAVLVTCVSMGNPHCVIFCDDVQGLDLPAIGPQYENHPMFPDRINTEFIRVTDKNTLEMRVWERGSGETLACGTGACAAAVAAVLCGKCEKNADIRVNLLGGSLTINWTDEGFVRMTGPATTVFSGEIEL